ncbi:MAG: hypothetical protein Q7U40_12085, partial [Desulfatirhabdiaceae bacterium]|nr:hypothetical protein [Desulfatirhabdiaceae bacterium]
KNVFLCHACGQLTETSDRKKPGDCRHCDARLLTAGPAKRNHCECSGCKTINIFPNKLLGAPRHRLFALEYHCPACKERHAGRFFKIPDSQDLLKADQAEERWAKTPASYVPDDEIPSGDETNRLHRWGYGHYREMFNARQLLGLELSAQRITRIADERVRNSLATNLSDLLRYQNMLCRYDTMALKSLDIFSVHGFPVGLVQCESNFLGIVDPKKRICIGSGGWANIIEKFRKAKVYCDSPFEIRHPGGRKEIVPINGEWIGDDPNGKHRAERRSVALYCKVAAQIELPPQSLDAVLTDPPYFGNVQYAELMDFCYVWLRRLIRTEPIAFAVLSTRNPQELTGNEEMGRGLPSTSTEPAPRLSTLFSSVDQPVRYPAYGWRIQSVAFRNLSMKIWPNSGPGMSSPRRETCGALPTDILFAWRYGTFGRTGTRRPILTNAYRRCHPGFPDSEDGPK